MTAWGGPRRVLLMGLTLLLLAGCATRGMERFGTEDAAARQARLLALTHWEARGRIAVKSSESGGQGNLQWVQTGDAARIRLSGPFGAGAYEIAWAPERLTVTSRNGEVALDDAGPDAAERFLTGQLGWSFPVASTRYWILGLADPAAPAAQTPDEFGRLAILTQFGWEVRYEEFTLKDATWLPRKLVMESERGRVRVVIDTWLL